MAEYETCIIGLQVAIEKKIKSLEVFRDFALVIYLLREDWETRDSKPVIYCEFVTKLIKGFDEINFNHLP